MKNFSEMKCHLAFSRRLDDLELTHEEAASLLDMPVSQIDSLCSGIDAWKGMDVLDMIPIMDRLEISSLDGFMANDLPVSKKVLEKMISQLNPADPSDAKVAELITLAASLRRSELIKLQAELQRKLTQEEN